MLTTYDPKVLPKKFPMNGYSTGFRPKTQVRTVCYKGLSWTFSPVDFCFYFILRAKEIGLGISFIFCSHTRLDF